VTHIISGNEGITVHGITAPVKIHEIEKIAQMVSVQAPDMANDYLLQPTDFLKISNFEPDFYDPLTRL
jgi:hypothetical protein